MTDRAATALAALFALSALGACGAGADPAAGAAPRGSKAAASIEEQRALFETASGSTAGAHAFEFDGLVLDRLPFAALAGKTVLVVNTASECGFTPQYEGLQTLYETYKNDGLVVVGVPSNDFGGQEPGSAEEIRDFCEMNYGVTFPMAAKSDVTGDDAHPFYQWAADELGDAGRPRWNFHKILIGPNGEALAGFDSGVKPGSADIASAVEIAIGAGG